LIALAAYGLLVVVACPGLVTSAIIDLPDDYLEFHAVVLSWFADGLGDGRIAWWDPYRAGGSPAFTGAVCMAPWYPWSWLLAVLPIDLFMAATWVFHLALGALGIDRLTRALGGGRAGGVAAGICTVLGSWTIAAVVDGHLDVAALLAWFPWAMLALQRLLDHLADGGGWRSSCRAAAGLAACLGLLGLGSHPRFAAITFGTVLLAAVLWWLLPPGGRRPRLLPWTLLVGLAAVVGGLLAAPSVLPAVAEVSIARSGPPPVIDDLVGQIYPARGLAGLVYPRAFILDDRWYRVGVAVLLPLLLLRSDRRLLAPLLAALLLLLLGMGTRGPLFLLVRPVHWLIYPVETGVAAMAPAFLAVAIGLAVQRVCDRGREELRPGSAALVAVVGLALVVFGWVAARGLFAPEVRSVPPIEAAALVHGAVAVVCLGVLVALRGRLGRHLATAMLVLILADGLAYAWRVEAAIPTIRLPASEFLAPPPALADVEPDSPPRRALALPLEPLRDFRPCLVLDDDPGHGWTPTPWFDPVEVVPADARRLLEGPLRLNAGHAAGIPTINGRPKVPPRPWSVFHQWLSWEGPLDLGLRQHQGPVEDEYAPETFEARAAPGADEGGPEARGRGSDDACSAGPLGQGPDGEGHWLPDLLEILHVRWVVSRFPIDPPPGTRRLPPVEGAPARFEVSNPRPPALVSPGLTPVPDLAAAEQVVFGDRVGLRDRPVVVGTDLEAGLGGSASEPEILRWQPGAWTLDVEGMSGLLTVVERFHPGWSARDQDGRPLRVLPANFVQLAAVIPEGTRQVELRFLPPRLEEGLLAGLLGLILLSGLLAAARLPYGRSRGGPAAATVEVE